MISNMNKYTIAILIPEPNMVARVQSSIYFDIIWLFFAFELLLDLTRDSILRTVSQMNFAALINR